MLIKNTLVDNRYQIEKELGRGGMGIVYLAQDKEKQKQVALKIVDPNAQQSKLRTKREFRIMSQLEHPYVISVYQSGIYQDQMPYIVMPYLSGGDLLNHYSGGIKEKVDLLPRLNRMVEIAEALHYIHHKGIIHRDLKPGNIMLNIDNKGNECALLMDFGLAKRQAQESVLVTLQNEKKQFTGSIQYASPEQISSRELDTRSDLYSLGCVMYWLIVGEPPFTGEIAAILGGHLHIAPKFPTQFSNSIPTILEEITLKLLEKKPDKRYNNSIEVISLLQEVIEKLLLKTQSKTQSPVQNITQTITSAQTVEFISLSELLEEEEDTIPVRLFIPPLIGREEQWQVCRAALENLSNDQSNNDQSNIVLLQGGIGVGLTRFLAEVEHEVNQQEFALLKFNNHQSNHLPYQPWQSVLQNLYQHKNEEFLKAVLGLEAALITLLPELSINEDYKLPADVNQMRLFQAVEKFLTHFFEKKPLVILVDNAHLADKGTIDLLAYLTRSPFTTTLTILAWHPDREHQELDSHIKKRFSELSNHNLTLEPLEEQKIKELLKAFLGYEFEIDLENYILERIGGNPLFAEEILSTLLKEKYIRLRQGVWEWSNQDVNLPERIGEVFTARLNILSESAQRTLSAASTIGRNFEFEVLCDLLALEEDDLLDDIDELLQAGLTEELEADRYRFAHVLLKEILHDKLSISRRRRYHQKLVDILKERKPEPAILADHYIETKEPYLAVPYALETARKAEKVFANDVAEHYFRMALNNFVAQENKHEQIQIQLELGSILERVGKWDEAESFYKAVEANETLYPRALHFLGGLSQARGDLEQSEQYLRQALELSPENVELHYNLGNLLFAKAKLPAAEETLHNGLAEAMKNNLNDDLALIHSGLGYLEYRRNNWEIALEWLVCAKEHIDVKQQPLKYAQIIDIEGAIYTRLGKLGKALQHYQEAYKIYKDAGDTGKAVKTLLQIGKVYQDEGELIKAIEVLEKVYKQAQRLGRESIKLDAMATLGWVLHRKGYFDKSLRLLEQSYSLLLNKGHRSKAVLHRMNMAVVAARYGKLVDAREYFQEADALLQKISISPFLLALAQLTLGEIELRDKQLEKALVLLEQVTMQLKSLQCQQELLEAKLLLAETQLALNDPDSCTSSLESAKQLTQEVNDPLAELQIKYIKALNNQNSTKVVELEEKFKLQNLEYLINNIKSTTSTSL